VLEIIVELSTCPQPTLFVVAATRGLQRFSGGTLDELGKLLGRCTQELQARGIVQINENGFITPAESPEDEDILELTTVAESVEHETIMLPTSDLELHTSVRSDKGAPGVQKQTQTQAQLKGNPETLEPTREEIIAAMRRFISDH
jgi:hypothetical protein